MRLRVSIASCTPWNKRRPSASILSSHWSVTSGQPRSMSCTRTLMETSASASPHTRVAALSTAKLLRQNTFHSLRRLQGDRVGPRTQACLCHRVRPVRVRSDRLRPGLESESSDQVWLRPTQAHQDGPRILATSWPYWRSQGKGKV